MTCAHGAQLLAGNGVAGEDRTDKFEGVNDSHNIIAEAVGRIARCGNTGRSKAPPGDAEHVIVCRQFGRELNEYTSLAAESCQENKRAAGPAPVYHLQLNILVHGYELSVM